MNFLEKQILGLKPVRRMRRMLEEERNCLQAERDQLREEIRRIQGVAPVVFFHIPKTGGSSIWLTLAEQAVRDDVTIIDLYQWAQGSYGHIENVYSVLAEHQRLMRHRPCLVHHHTPHPIGEFFEATPRYATVVRDPLDRFVSEVNHLVDVIRKNLNEEERRQLVARDPEGEGAALGLLALSPDFIEAAADPARDLAAVARIAVREDFLRRHYYWSFSNLLDGKPHPRVERTLPEGGLSLPELGRRVRGTFAYIGSFSDVHESCCRICEVFGFSAVPVREGFRRELQRNSGQLLGGMRSSLAPLFAEEYDLLEEIGVPFSRPA